MQAIGIARQSHGDGASVEDQTARIREHAKREGWDLVDVLAEQDISGGRPLAKRPGLLAAVEAVEQGRATIIVVAYFDRLVRSLKVQAEVVERVEAAGGKILALDMGAVTHATAAAWLSSTMLGMLSDYYRRSGSERAKASHEDRKAKGLWTGGKVPFYRQVTGAGTVEIRRDMIPHVRVAVSRRLEGDSVAQVADLLRERTGLPLKSLNIVQRMLRDESLVADGVVTATDMRRLGTLVTKRGKRPESDRLLARLGILNCPKCGGDMNVHGSAGPNQVYRCHRGSKSDPGHAAISVQHAEDTVSHAVRVALKGFKGSAGESLEALEERLRSKQAARDAMVMAFDGIGDAEAVKSKLAVAQGEIDAAEDALADARAAAGFDLLPGLDWPVLGHAKRRELIRAVVSVAVVHPAEGKRARQLLDPATGDMLKISERIEIELADAFHVDAILDDAARSLKADLDDLAAEREPVKLTVVTPLLREAATA